MKKWFVGAALIALCSTTAFAQSSKSTLQMGNNEARLVSGGAGASDTGWNVIMGNGDINAANAVRIHTSQQKDLVFGASFECGVYTKTQAKTKGGNVDTSKAEAKVEIRIVVDPGTADERTAYPGEVTFCYRYQELSVKLQGILDLACVDTNGDGNLDTCNLEVVDDEYVELIQDTLNANAFFFALDDLGTGTHNIVVQARVTSSTDFLNGAAAASALIGKGAVTVEESRLIKGGDIDVN